MRVGLVSKGLLLKGDSNLELVLLCSNKPTVLLLKEVAEKLTAELEVQHRDNRGPAGDFPIISISRVFFFSLNRKTQQERTQLVSVQGMLQSPWPAPSRSWLSPYTWRRLLSGLSRRAPAQKPQKETEVWTLSRPPDSRQPFWACSGRCCYAGALLHWSKKKKTLWIEPSPLCRRDQVKAP